MRRLLAFVVFLVACSARASPGPGPDSQLFDQPKTVKSTAGPQTTPSQSFDCTWYSDYMIQETETDSPSRGPSYLIPLAQRGLLLSCPVSIGAHDVKLATENTTFVGRKSQFLFYESTEASDAEPFSILRTSDGKEIYRDSLEPGQGFKAIALDGNNLHLTYIRAYNAPCSLIKEGALCWSRSMKEGHFAHAIAAMPPPVKACTARYRASQAPPEDNSVITYPVEILLTRDGVATVLSRGALGCLPAS